MYSKISQIFVRKVSTVSPLTAAFNRLNHKTQSFPRFFDRKTGLFGYELLSKPSGFYLFRENAIIESDRLVREAISPQRHRKMVEIFDQMSNNLCKVADMAEFIRVSHPNHQFCHSAEEASVAISAEVEKLNTNKVLYNSLKNAFKNGDQFPTTAIDDYVMQMFLIDFEQNGIHLSEEDRHLVVNLNQHILHVGSYFLNSTSQHRSVSKSKLPEEIRSSFKSDGDNVMITGLYNDSDNELVREAAYRIFLYPDEHQERLLTELLMSRQKLAKICGFKSYAQRAVTGSIADTPETVMQLIDFITDRLRPIAEQDFEEMLKTKSLNKKYSKSMKLWDISYISKAFKRNTFNEDIKQCAPYFSLGVCMDGLNSIFSAIFGVYFEISEITVGECWHSDVIKLSVIDSKTNTKLGIIYCDFFERSTKPHHDCHFTIQGGCQLPDGSYQLPIVVLSLSLPNPTANSPSLLPTYMVENLFHEMGHAMHSMLARTPYQHIAGTRCSTDLAEVPSILMEFFAFDRRVVKTFAKHFKTGEEIPEKLLDVWLKSKNTFMASDLQLQVFYSALDQTYHSSDPLMGLKNTSEVLSRIQSHYYSLPPVPNTAWQLRFGHLVGYGAKYYSYLVSKSVAASIWKRFFQNDPFSASSGQLYREQVLSHGGGKPPKLVVENVLQQNISAKSLSDSLIDYVLESYEDINENKIQ